MVGKLDEQHTETHDDADHHDAAHEGLNVEARTGEEQYADHADGAQRHGEHDDERIEKRPELKNHDEIDQNDRQQEPETERLKRFAHGLHLAAHLNEVAFRDLGTVVTNAGDEAFDVCRDRTDVAPAHVDEDIGDTGDVVVIDFDWGGGVAEFGEVPQGNGDGL